MHHRRNKLQLKSYASDLLEDAMNLAQTKAINSFSFRDCLNTLTELWGYCYEKMAQIDSGFYTKVYRLTSKLSKVPRDCKHIISVFSAIDVVGYSRKVYRAAGPNDMNSPFTFYSSGKDLYCWDADLRNIWVEYLPEPPMVFFTKNNRDPKILTYTDTDISACFTAMAGSGVNYGTWRFHTAIVKDSTGITVSTPIKLRPRNYTVTGDETEIDVTDAFIKPDWTIKSFISDYPYVFVSYRNNNATDQWESWIYKDLIGRWTHSRYNPFDYSGRPSNVQYLSAKYNDYTGMGCQIINWNADTSTKYMELGWTPDTLMIYPTRVMYNYMVATMAQRFAALNGSQIMGVELALVQAKSEMDRFLKQNKSAWERINNVTGPTWADFL